MADGEFDVVVIGSGPGGSATAWSLCRQGVKVALLEAGPAYNYLTDYRLDTDSWERIRFPSKMQEHRSYLVAQLQKLDPRWKDLRSWNHISGLMNSSEHRGNWGYHHVQGVGGTTLHFLGEAHRLHPQSMQMESRFGVAADWPITYEELEPHYLSAERLVGVAGPVHIPGRWRSQPYPLPAHRLSYASQKVEQGCRALGLTLSENSLAILSDVHDERPPCNYCANCMRGCPRADKGSADVTFVAKALATGRLTLKAESRAVQIETGPNDRVTTVQFLDPDGKLDRISARAIVVSCGAVHTPRLLLVSGGNHAPDGLANESGQVGRNFMETLQWTASGLHQEALGSHRGLPADSICWNFNAPDSIPDVVGGCRFTIGAAQADLVGPINYARRVVEGWGRAHKRRMRETFGRVVSITSIGESLPHPGSYVELDAEQKDSNGLPLPRINSFLDDMELRRLSFMANKSREILLSSGAADIFEEYGSYDHFNTTHVFGTCRMGLSAERSVVNEFCRSHRWRNLFIVDASVFPSSGGGEAPSLTIEALGLRTAAYIGRSLGNGDL